jgi:protein CpxP
MKNIIRFLVGLTAVTLIGGLAVSQASAFQKGRHGGGQPCMQMNGMMKGLGLTDQQKAKMNDVMKAQRAGNEGLFKQYFAEKRALRKLIHGDTFDEAAIRAQAAKVAALEGDMAVSRAKMAQEMRSILTPDQIKKLKERQAKWEQRMQGRLGDGRGECPFQDTKK